MEHCHRYMTGSKQPYPWEDISTGTVAAASNFKSPNNNNNNVVLLQHEQHNLFDLNHNDFLGGEIISCTNQLIPTKTNTSYFGFGNNIHVDDATIHSPTSSSSNKATVKNEVLRAAKRQSTTPSHQEQPKKPRIGGGSQRHSCPVLKVRKEKLGDRISALHRLVAPFGKTDTASVLTEAIGYIQFLHDQVQALSMPYMNSSGARSCHIHRTSRALSSMKIEDDESAVDLKSRGLCLVPLSLTSYISSSCPGICLSRNN